MIIGFQPQIPWANGCRQPCGLLAANLEVTAKSQPAFLQGIELSPDPLLYVRVWPSQAMNTERPQLKDLKGCSGTVLNNMHFSLRVSTLSSSNRVFVKV